MHSGAGALKLLFGPFVQLLVCMHLDVENSIAQFKANATEVLKNGMS
jgi:hypothetical protein